MIALEPEAASLHCRHLPDTNFVGYKDNGVNKPTFEPGTKYLVVDAGGMDFFWVRVRVRCWWYGLFLG